MSEGTHSHHVPSHQGHRKPLVAVGAGSILLLLVAGVWFQFFQVPQGQAQTALAETSGLPSAGAASSRVLAKVNNSSISYDAVAQECVQRYGAEVLDSMINRLVIQQECERQGVSVSRSEVEQEVIEIAKKFKLPLDTWYQMLQSERGMSREQYHSDVIWPMLALKKLAGNDIQVTEEDMQRGFERDYGPRMKGRMILIEGNQRHATQIGEKCQANPDDFDRLAREYSADSNTRPLGGVIPPIRRFGGNEAVENEAFRLRPGEVSAVIALTENRYVILKCEGFTEPVVTDVKEVWNDLYAQLVEEKTQEAVGKVFEGIKSRAVVHNFLTRTSTGTPVSAAAGVARPGGTAVVPAFGQ